MSAHHIRHALSCPANGNGRLVDCMCDAPGSAKAKEAAALRERARAPVPMLETEGDGDDDEIMTMPGPAAPTSSDLPGVTAGGQVLASQAQLAALSAMYRQIVGTAAMNADDPPQVSDARIDRDMLDRVGDLVSSMSYRLVSLERVPGYDDPRMRPIVVSQVCPACRELHTTLRLAQPGGDDLAVVELALVTLVGIAARRARLEHHCPLIEAQRAVLAEMSSAELQDLAAELERDGTIMIGRSIAVAELAADAMAREKTTT